MNNPPGALGISGERARGILRVKFCGFTREEDARAALDLGVDAIGFNFWERSRRGLNLAKAASWIERLPRTAEFVAVLVNPTPEFLHEIAASGLFDSVQFHGSEPPKLCAISSLPWIRAIPCPLTADFSYASESYATRRWLLDAAVAGQFGGTGRTADWSAARDFVRQHQDEEVWLAGGLHDGNVVDAVLQVGPSGVDVAGGIESAPGIKCAKKMRSFLDAVRRISMG